MDFFRIEGGSMRPFLRAGDEVGVEWVSSTRGDFRLGELWLGRESESAWVVHRLVRYNESDLVLKGDAAFAEAVLNRENLWARVVAVRRRKFRPNLIDALIAECSRRHWRKLVFALGWLRRSLP